MMSARTDGVVGLQLSKHQYVMFAYAFATENRSYFKNVQKVGTTTKMPIFDKEGKLLRHVGFNAPVTHVINNTWNTGKDMEGEDVYFLLENGDVLRSKCKKLEKVPKEDTMPFLSDYDEK